ncbi:N-acetylneuraminate lyase A-like [Anopheles marshallii]|uniref:N-acetylneuraminate lyase A-like n=1 Tax=Anopheles marshallii TaxID=1521116 RepID=UPI00237AAFA1|nr:N-acetylneuraminate lyase A-like [Anopheles marshallii]
MKTFNFTGLMAPVFTPYHNGNETLNIAAIEPYVELLKAKHVNGVLVNGTSGEGMLLNTEERILVTAAWQRACKKHGITVMVQIGGAPYPDVVQLARHALQIDVDAVLCLPELYFKPKTSEQLVAYMKSIAKHCPTIPFFYYHIPMFTDVNVHMPTFLDGAEKEIPNFRGIKYTSGDLDQGSACLKEGRTIFLGADSILCGAVAAGFDSFIMTTLNICPEVAFEIITDVNRGAVKDARDKQRKLNAHISTILKHGDWVSAMKNAFREKFPSIVVGSTRPPLNK